MDSEFNHAERRGDHDRDNDRDRKTVIIDRDR
jgi:hypothetical protein